MGDEAKKKGRRRGRGCLVALGVLLVLLSAGWVVYGGGRHEEPGTVTDRALPEAMVAARGARQEPIAQGASQILFGDLHVHTTFSADAFMMSLPLLGGEGAHPPADACDFARFCSDLDFFALTDHAEALTPEHWRESIETMRRCDAVSGRPEDPDLVTFMGFEWSHVGPTPETHYGHKNVIFRDLSDEALPARPIGSRGLAQTAMTTAIDPWLIPLVPILDFDDRQRYLDLAVFFQENAALDECPPGIDTRELPADCREHASTPQELFEKLDQWGSPALVIPHGTTWGFYTPAGYRWDKQIAPEQDDPERQRLIEVYSGHGNSEEYRPWRAMEGGEEDTRCPEPTDDYEPCCFRAGEIIRSRCGDAPAEECERRVREARQSYVLAGVGGHLTVPGATPEDWAGCGQCTDCFDPSFNYRPGGSVQYILARGNFDDPSTPRHHVMGFIASSDNHSARPGTGYKEIERYRFTEATGPREPEWRDRIWGEPEEAAPEARRLSREWLLEQAPFRLLELERQASFFMTGGLVAVHAEGRGRDAIWDALHRRRVYGTSGDRILLWFDLLEGEVAHPMGSDVRSGATPRFRVRAAGAFEQLPGCPDVAAGALGAERLENVCAGECYHPSDQRRRITRIEVVRIRPQQRDDEPVEVLIEDPWRVLPCEGSTDACVAEWEDPGFVSGGRDVVYYVRAIQEPTPAVNAGGLRCDEDGCSPCWGDSRTPMEDDCLTANEERAWSSPIWVRFDAEAARAAAAPDAGVGE